MAIELTSASKSTRVGILSALDSGISGLPSLDGISYADKAEVIYSDEAVEGTSIPDGSNDSFVKTYTLSRSYPNGAYVVASPDTNPDNNFAFPFPKLAQVASQFPNLSAIAGGGSVNTNYIFYMNSITGTSIPNFSLKSKLIFVTSNYTQATKLHATLNASPSFPSPKDASGNTITQIGFGNTYSQLTNNCLVGTYGGPFGGAKSDSYFNTTATGIRFVLESAYLDGNSLKFLFKKQESSSSAVLQREGILIVDGSI